MRLLPRLALSLLLLTTAPAAHAVVFVVNTTSDASDASLTDALCDIGTGDCSLRAAIEQANATVGADRIEFAIPGPVPHEILIGTAPVILESLAIDGTTQPGSSVNTLAIGTNAVFGINLSGPFGSAGAEIHVDAPNVDLRGLSIYDPSYVDPGLDTGPCVVFGPNSTGSRFRGNKVHRCLGGAVQVEGDRARIGDTALASRNLINDNTFGILVTGDDNFIVNNLIGTTASGDLPMGTGTNIELVGDGNTVTDNTLAAGVSGVTISGNQNTLVRNRIGGLTTFGLGNTFGVQISGSANQIGFPSAGLAQGNEIFGNAAGVSIDAPGGGNLVQGNRIGGPGLANGSPIRITGSSGNTVSENVISQNQEGVWILEANAPSVPAIDNVILANRIWGNGQISLRLGVSGSPHDDAPVGSSPDIDEGPNHLQNPPHITGVSASQGQTEITGNIDALAGPYTLEFFSNPACASGRREGQYYLGAASLAATGTFTNPRTSFSYTLPVTAQGAGFTATATDVDGNTSEFSTCYTAAITGGADLVLTGSPSSSPTLDPGDTVQFSIRLENRGPFAATNIPVVVTRTPGFLSGWTASPGFDPATGIWTVSNLAVGAAVQLELEATVLPAAAGLFAVDARAETGLSQLDPNSLDNAARISRFVRSGADLVVDQAAPLSAEDGELVTFGVTVRNLGPEDASSVTVSGILDEGLVFDSSNALPFRFSYAPATRRWTWDAEDLANQATASLYVYARVDAALAPDVALQHTVSAFATSPSDPLPMLSTKVVGLGPVTDLKLALSGDVEKRQWSASVHNSGPNPVGSFLLRLECGESSLEIEAESFSPNCPAGARFDCPFVCSMGSLPVDGTKVLKLLRSEDLEPYSIAASIEIDPDSPFFDTYSVDNSSILVRSPIRCGLLGIESPILLGLLVLLRGRKGRAAFRRIFPGAALALALLLGGSARTAQATPVALAIDSGASSATVAVTSTLGSPPPVAVTLSGSVDADVALGTEAPFGLVAQSLQLTGAAMALSDFSIVLSSVPLYNLMFNGNDVAGSLSGPSASGFAVAPGLSLFDLFGSSLTFDSGSIDATGTYYGFPVSETFDFSSFPLHSVFPINSVAQLQVVDLGGGAAGLSLSIPFSTPLQLVIDSEPVTVTIAGTLVATGQVVPEPGTASLLAAGLLTFAAVRRRVLGAVPT